MSLVHTVTQAGWLVERRWCEISKSTPGGGVKPWAPEDQEP